MSDTVPLADSRGKIRKLAKNKHVIVRSFMVPTAYISCEMGSLVGNNGT